MCAKCTFDLSGGITEGIVLLTSRQSSPCCHEELLFYMKSKDERVIVHVTVICTIFVQSSKYVVHTVGPVNQSRASQG